MRFYLALVLGKLFAFWSRLRKKPDTKSGDIALRICPDFLSRIKSNAKIIAVTGSNGKTTTTALLLHVLKNCGLRVSSNLETSNMLGGVASAFIGALSLRGQVVSDYFVLEIDELFLKIVLRHLSLDYLLITNFFRDQQGRNGNIDILLKNFEEAVGPSTMLILNGNDPISSGVLPNNQRAYYSLGPTVLSSPAPQNITHDAKVCPGCMRRLHYSYYHYNHIGRYNCAFCGKKTPEAKYYADNVDFQYGKFEINRAPVATTCRNLYNILNITGAIAAAAEIGIELKTACEAASLFEMPTDLQRRFSIGDREALILNSIEQNPVSYDQAIAHMLSVREEKTVVAYIGNTRHSDCKDTTWLYDISFERIVSDVKCFVCTGPRAYDLAVRLHNIGVSGAVIVEPEVNKLKEAVAQTTGTVYIMAEPEKAAAIAEVLKK